METAANGRQQVRQTEWMCLGKKGKRNWVQPVLATVHCVTVRHWARQQQQKPGNKVAQKSEWERERKGEWVEQTMNNAEKNERRAEQNSSSTMPVKVVWSLGRKVAVKLCRRAEAISICHQFQQGFNCTATITTTTATTTTADRPVAQ